MSFAGELAHQSCLNDAITSPWPVNSCAVKWISTCWDNLSGKPWDISARVHFHRRPNLWIWLSQLSTQTSGRQPKVGINSGSHQQTITISPWGRCADGCWLVLDMGVILSVPAKGKRQKKKKSQVTSWEIIQPVTLDVGDAANRDDWGKTIKTNSLWQLKMNNFSLHVGGNATDKERSEMC